MRRALSIALRTAHLAVFGLLLGGHAFAVDPVRLLPALWLTVLTGIGLAAAEMYATGPGWILQGKGLAVLAKLGLLLLVPVFWEARVPLMLAVVVIASVGSHMPARFRHYSIARRRVIGVEASLARASVSDRSGAGNW